jgi:hypothetical protein
MSLSNVTRSVRDGDRIHVIDLPPTFWSKTRPDDRRGTAGCDSIRAVHFERIASAKFDKKTWETVGITIIGPGTDISGSAAANGYSIS